MRVGMIQSNYLPWRGYFDFIASCDVFVFHDDLQYTKQDWRNRNKVKMPGGTQWITVPVRNVTTDTAIDRAEIDNSVAWIYRHAQALEGSLGGAPFYRDASALFAEITTRFKTIAELNQALIRSLCLYLGVTTTLINARSLGCIGKKTEKILAICRVLGATSYLSGPAARQYLDVDLLNRNGIEVEWKEYNYLPYRQTHGAYDGYVTVLDLIANLGPEARNHITSIPEAELAKNPLYGVL